MTKLVRIMRPQAVRGFNNLMSHASKSEVTQNNTTNSDCCETPNSVLLKTRNNKMPSNKDPILAMIEYTRLLLKRSNLNSTITTVSNTTVITPMPNITNPTL